MTEDEAKTKWCPMVRAGVYGEGPAANATVAVNRDPRHDDIALCVGSSCMMWREIPMPLTDAEIDSGVAVMYGYCGLAPMQIPPVNIEAAVPFTASELNALKDRRRIAGGVYSNPQPGDADFPGEPKTDIGSGG